MIQHCKLKLIIEEAMEPKITNTFGICMFAVFSNFLNIQISTYSMLMSGDYFLTINI